jgi:hypothetical protein
MHAHTILDDSECVTVAQQFWHHDVDELTIHIKLSIQ